jgi:hypothetical protein
MTETITKFSIDHPGFWLKLHGEINRKLEVRRERDALILRMGCPEHSGIAFGQHKSSGAGQNNRLTRSLLRVVRGITLSHTGTKGSSALTTIAMAP